MESSCRKMHKGHALAFTASASTLAILLPLTAACTRGTQTEQTTPAPTITSFNAFPSPIRKNDSVNLIATFANGEGLLEPGGQKIISGIPVKLKPEEKTTYTVTITNAAGVKATRKATVDVLPTGTPTLSLVTEIPSLSDTAAGIALDGSGNLYLSNPHTGVISTIAATGEARVLAGKSLELKDTDGPGEFARFRSPCSMAIDGPGNLYVADVGNGTVRRITPEGEVRTLAGVALEFGGRHETDREARFKRPWGLAVDATGNVYVGDTVDHTIRKVLPEGMLIDYAGNPEQPGTSDGPRNSARFDQPEGIAVDSAGNIWVADRLSHTIRKVNPAGEVTTVAGRAGVPGMADGVGSAATFNCPTGLAVDKSGNLYVADSGNNTIRKVNAAGVVSTLAGIPGSQGTKLGALPGLLNNPRYIALDASTGNLLVSQPGSILKITF